MKVTYYVAASIDGYIAKKDGDVSWLDELEIPIEDTGYNDFFSSVDGLIVGRKTYEMINNFGLWPYGEKPVWVCSQSSVNPVNQCNLQEEITPQRVRRAANEKGFKHLWCIGGGELASSLHKEKMLTDIYVSIMPIFLGEGIKHYLAILLFSPNYR